MSRLSYNSTKAERDAGCFFAESFESQTRVEDNNISVGGSPTFSIQNGAVFDGTNDCLTSGVFTANGSLYHKNSFSFYVKFKLEFDTDEDENRRFFEATDAAGSVNDRYALYKLNNANSNTLSLYLGETAITGVPEATYSPYWNKSEWNTIVVSCESGDNSIC